MYINPVECIAGEDLTFLIYAKSGTSPVDISLAEFTGSVRSDGAKVANFLFDLVNAKAGIIRVILPGNRTRVLRTGFKPYEWAVTMTQGEFSQQILRGSLRVGNAMTEEPKFVVMLPHIPVINEVDPFDTVDTKSVRPVTDVDEILLLRAAVEAANDSSNT